MGCWLRPSCRRSCRSTNLREEGTSKSGYKRQQGSFQGVRLWLTIIYIYKIIICCYIRRWRSLPSGNFYEIKRVKSYILNAPACPRRYSRSSFVLSGPRVLPQPFKGTTMTVPLSAPPSSSEKERILSAATFGLGVFRTRSTTSWSESMDETPSEMSTAHDHSLPTHISWIVVH
jgi:hypothetical protein